MYATSGLLRHLPWWAHGSMILWARRFPQSQDGGPLGGPKCGEPSLPGRGPVESIARVSSLIPALELHVSSCFWRNPRGYAAVSRFTRVFINRRGGSNRQGIFFYRFSRNSLWLPVGKLGSRAASGGDGEQERRSCRPGYRGGERRKFPFLLLRWYSHGELVDFYDLLRTSARSGSSGFLPDQRPPVAPREADGRCSKAGKVA